MFRYFCQDVDGIVQLAKKEAVGLVVVGPEVPPTLVLSML